MTEIKECICPKCKAEIDNLDFDVTATCSGCICSADVQSENGKIEAYDSDSLLSNVQFSDFRCPECNELIGNGTEDDAIKFLKGEM
jgi:hypothetical protein